LQEEHRAAAEWARDNLPPEARIACLDIGILGYYSKRSVADLGGLIDPSIIPDLEHRRVGPYLVKKRATHYFALTRHDSERITGVKKDENVLYRLRLLQRFDAPPYSEPPPVFLHSLGIEVYEILPLAPPPAPGPKP
jgi:hypothetical protein